MLPETSQKAYPSRSEFTYYLGYSVFLSSTAKRLVFEAKRKAHYKEFYAVQLARKLMERDALEEDETGGSGEPQPPAES
jgi:hypothetical protein